MKNITIVFVLLLTFSHAQAYTLKLDFDHDLDPSTLQTTTDAQEDTVSIHVWPDEPGETVDYLLARIGGSCTACNGAADFQLLVSIGLFDVGYGESVPAMSGFENLQFCDDPWPSTCTDSGLSLDRMYCADDGPAVVLDGPVTLIRFFAQALDNEGQTCPEGPSRRIAVSTVSGITHTVEFETSQVPVGHRTWGQIKATYR